jgi:hypothetical protein
MKLRYRMTYHVRPRYTCGSPAMVDEATARRVADEEVRAIAASLSGMIGPIEKQRAESLGLAGIAVGMIEHRDHFMLDDLITHVITQQPFYGEKLKRTALSCKHCSTAREIAAYNRRTNEQPE